MSCARRVASTSVSIHRTAPAMAPAGTSWPTDSRSASVTPASTSVPASAHASATPRSSSHSPTASSQSAAAQRVERRRRALPQRFGQSVQARAVTGRRDPMAHRSAARSGQPGQPRLRAPRRRGAPRRPGCSARAPARRPACPSAVIFSRCCITRVASRTRSVIIDTSRWPSTGMRASISPNWSLRIRRIRRTRPAAARPAPAYLTHARERQQARDLAGVLHEGRHHLAADADQQVDGAFEDHEHAVGRVALAEDHLAGAHTPRPRRERRATSNCSSANPASTSTRRSSSASGTAHSITSSGSTSPSPRPARASGRSGCVVCVEVLGRMLVRRAVAAADVAARHAEAQVDPGGADAQTVLAAPRARAHGADLGDVAHVPAVGASVDRMWPCRCLCAISGSWLSVSPASAVDQRRVAAVADGRLVPLDLRPVGLVGAQHVGEQLHDAFELLGDDQVAARPVAATATSV